MPILFLLLIFNLSLSAQTYQVYAIQPDGERGDLLRTEIYVDNNKMRSQHFTEDGKLNYEINYQYDNANNLIERIQTFKNDHEFDLIRQYSYDEMGRKIGELFGNNRTGKWGSYRFNYNPQGDLDSVFVYQKNGDLTNLRTFDISYDAAQRKISERINHVDLELEETERGQTFVYVYSEGRNTQTVIEKDTKGQMVATQTTTYNAQNKPEIVSIIMPEQPILKSIYRYNKQGYVVEIQEFTDGKRSLTTTQQFTNQGILLLKKYRFPDGTFGGETYVRR